MKNEERKKLERVIVRTLVREMISAGFVPVRVWDGDGYNLATNEDDVVEQAFAVDESTVHFARKENRKDWGRLGVMLIAGEGHDIVADWHCQDEDFDAAVGRACRKAEEL